MRKLLLSLIVLALGLGGAFLAFSPRAGAHGLVDGTLTGSVGTSDNHDTYAISLSASKIATAGTYQFNITDYSQIHNFDLCKGTSCTGSNSVDMTDVAGTGSVSWTVTLTNGTYTYMCDAHHGMNGQLQVGPPPLTASITKVTSTRRLVTAYAKANRAVHFKAWLLQGTKQLATTSNGTTLATTATLKLTPATALKQGYYVVQVRAFTSSTIFKVVRKKIYVM